MTNRLRPAGGADIGDLTQLLTARRAAARAGGGLTTNDERILAGLLADPHLATFGTAADVGARVDASAAAVVRCARRLGFDGWAQLRDTVRALLVSEGARASGRLNAQVEGPLAPVLLDFERMMSRLATLDEAGEINSLADVVATAGQVWIVSGFEARGVATTWVDQLRVARPNVRLVDSDPVAAAHVSVDLKPDDVVLALDLPRYDQRVLDTCDVARSQRVATVAVCDSPIGALADACDRAITLPIATVGPHDSYVGMAMLGEVVTARVSFRLRDSALERISRLERQWDRWGALIEPE